MRKRSYHNVNYSPALTRALSSLIGAGSVVVTVARVFTAITVIGILTGFLATQATVSGSTQA